MKRMYFRYINPWTGEIRFYPYIQRGMPQRPTPQWQRDQECDLDDRMKKGASNHPALRLIVFVGVAILAALLILSVLEVIPGNFQDHRDPSNSSQYGEEFPIEYYEKGGH